MTRFLVSPAAANDLMHIHAYIASDNPEKAREVRMRFEDVMRRLAVMPHLGHVRSDLANERLRVFPVSSYLIIYRPKTVPIQIVRVISGYQDLTLAMESPD